MKAGTALLIKWIKQSSLMTLFAILIGGTVLWIASKYLNPAPPKRFVIATGQGEGDYETYAKLYRDIIKDDGVELVLRPSKGASDNFRLLKDESSEVEAAFVQDGLGTVEEAPDVSSLGSLYYEPVWVFARANDATISSRLHQLKGKRIAVGPDGGGTWKLATQLLGAAGVNSINSDFSEEAWNDAAEALTSGQVDAAFFLSTPDATLIKSLIADKRVKLMSLDQAEAITRQFPYLHHLVLPHGAIDLSLGLPEKDVDLVSPTATLLVKDSLHSALAYLLLKAASQVHSEPGIFEKKGEFPIDKDYEFPLSNEAKTFYKSGTPFWQRYLPFWLATLIDRFIFVVIPLLAVLIPVLRWIPKFLTWRVKTRLYQRYGELKYLETQMRADPRGASSPAFQKELDEIENRVHEMKAPLDFSDHLYVLKEHIAFVRRNMNQEPPHP